MRWCAEIGYVQKQLTEPLWWFVQCYYTGPVRLDCSPTSGCEPSAKATSDFSAQKSSSEQPRAAFLHAAWQFPCSDSSLSPRSEEHTSELQSRGHLVCR